MASGDAECFLHVGDGAGEFDGAAFGAGGIGFDLQAELRANLRTRVTDSGSAP